MSQSNTAPANTEKSEIVKEEEKIIEYWKSIDIINKLKSAKKPKGLFSFTEGPPTANGKPGVHHVLSRSMKDIILRYRFMKGYWIPRKAGWDTHGLPVEIEVEKELGLHSKKEVLKYGIAEYNKKCRESVFRYIKDWENLTDRMAFWLDMKDAYITYENYFIESVWWSLKQLGDRGLIYKGHKVVPFCPSCGTPLSSHEVALGYQNVKEETVYIKFKLLSQENTYILAWTTTPWTLLSNVALAANGSGRYALVKYQDANYIVATALIPNVFKGNFEIVREFLGADLLYQKYEPLFPYFANLAEKNAFIVVNSDYVDTELKADNISTGFVHIACAFGEDDYNVGIEYELPFLQPIDENGYFDESIPELKGKYFKVQPDQKGKKGVWDTDKWVIGELKKMNKLFGMADYEHDYPFCWRCKMALLYYARESWFIKVSAYCEDLVNTNSKVNWIPPSIGEGRFNNFIENARDWAISRERFWGTPLPFWVCSNEKCNEIEFIGSYQELKEKSIGNIELQDYHKPHIDAVKLKCKKCGSEMIRTPEVLDCWYDSGAAPFAQYHYPFENKEIVEKEYPMDFICEGMDQTRGWFYSLHAIATLVFNHEAYRNVISTGLVLDGEGQKMSKSKGNIIDPWSVFNTYGADAIRFLYYVMNQPHKAKWLSLDEVKGTLSQFVTKIWNIYTFFKQNAEAVNYKPKKIQPSKLTEKIDKWLYSQLNKTIQEVDSNLEKYLIFEAAVALQNFVVNDLSNWYIRVLRSRFQTLDENAFGLLYHAIFQVIKLAAPFIPFMTERVYLALKNDFKVKGLGESVHFEDYPTADTSSIDEKLNEQMGFLETFVQDLRGLRAESKIKVRQPIKRFIIYVKDEEHKTIIKEFEALIKDQLNVKALEFIGKEESEQYYTESLVIDKKAIGKSFKEYMKKITPELDALTVEEYKKKKGKIVIKISEDKKIELTKEYISLKQESKEGFNVLVSNAAVIILDQELGDEMKREGAARDLNRILQNFRKEHSLKKGVEKLKLVIDSSANVEETFGSYLADVLQETNTVELKSEVVSEETAVLKLPEKQIKIKISII